MEETNNHGAFGSLHAKATSLLPKEEQQIIDAADNWLTSEPIPGEQYFKDTFKQ